MQNSRMFNLLRVFNFPSFFVMLFTPYNLQPEPTEQMLTLNTQFSYEHGKKSKLKPIKSLDWGVEHLPISNIENVFGFLVQHKTHDLVKLFTDDSFVYKENIGCNNEVGLIGTAS